MGDVIGVMSARMAGQADRPAMYRQNSFTALRLAAALQVLLSHAASHLDFDQVSVFKLIALFPGVPVFFFLSGYLVSDSFDRSASLADYARRRFSRIFPALWGALAFSVVTLVLLHPVQLRTLMEWTALQATGAQVWHPEAWRGYGVGVVNGSLWSIPVELAFYAALPLLARLRNAALLTLAIASIAILYAAAGAHEGLVLISPLPWFGLFIAGMLARRLDWRPSLKLWLPVLLLVLALSAASPVAGIFENRGNTSGIANLVALCAAALALGQCAGVRLRADLSYGLYLYHMPVLNAALGLGLAGKAALAATLAGSATMAALSWLAIERPGRRHRKAEAITRHGKFRLQHRSAPAE